MTTINFLQSCCFYKEFHISFTHLSVLITLAIESVATLNGFYITKEFYTYVFTKCLVIGNHDSSHNHDIESDASIS